MWGSNSCPQDQELRALLTESARHLTLSIFLSALSKYLLILPSLSLFLLTDLSPGYGFHFLASVSLVIFFYWMMDIINFKWPCVEVHSLLLTEHGGLRVISYRVLCSSAQSFQSLFFSFIRVRLQLPLF